MWIYNVCGIEVTRNLIFLCILYNAFPLYLNGNNLLDFSRLSFIFHESFVKFLTLGVMLKIHNDYCMIKQHATKTNISLSAYVEMLTNGKCFTQQLPRKPYTQVHSYVQQFYNI